MRNGKAVCVLERIAFNSLYWRADTSRWCIDALKQRAIVAHAFIFHITFIIARHTANSLRIFHLPGFS
jgi:hypothetical protein